MKYFIGPFFFTVINTSEMPSDFFPATVRIFKFG